MKFSDSYVNHVPSQADRPWCANVYGQGLGAIHRHFKSPEEAAGFLSGFKPRTRGGTPEAMRGLRMRKGSVKTAIVSV